VSEVTPNRSTELGRALIDVDQRFDGLIARFGLPPKRSVVKPVDRFAYLCRAILHQQLATRAAEAITARVFALANGAPTAAFMVEVEEDDLRACGVSGAKSSSLFDLARRVEDGSITLKTMARLSDEAVIAQLTAVRGIGPWTAQMFLMSALARPDVWPVLDYGVRAGWTVLHGGGPLITPKALELAGEPYRPMRSSVAWYCWRLADEAKEQRSTPS
jgi:DNA-3-methyladenine glycosylase II